jgi:membrane protein
MVIGIGFLLLVSLLLSAVLSALNKYLSDTFLSLPSYVFAITDIVIPLLVIFVLFMVVYKVLPDVSIHWKDVWVGSLVTSALFVLGKYLIGLYLGGSTVASTYGAAGSLVIFLLWIYYSAQILFLGAEFTKVYVERIGRGVKTSDKFMRYEESQLEVKEDSTP